jgi:RNA recognition motif-containing protein
MKIYVGNLSKQVSDAQLNDLAVPYGALQSAKVTKDSVSGESKGFGFVEFLNEDEAQAAISGLDGRQIEGRALQVRAEELELTQIASAERMVADLAARHSELDQRMSAYDAMLANHRQHAAIFTDNTPDQEKM